MAPPRVTKEQAQHAIEAVRKSGGSYRQAAALVGMSERCVRNRVECGVRYFQLRPPEVVPPVVEDLSAASARELSRLEESLRLLKKENAQLRESQATAEKLKALIHDCRFAPTVPSWRLVMKAHHNTGVPTMMLSDVHWDEVVDPAQINHVNAYNREIATRRLKVFFTAGAELWLSHLARPKYDYIVVPFAGDMLSGNIHEELRETNEAPIALSVMSLIDVLIPGLSLLADLFGRVYVPCVTGNHGRIDKKPRAKNRAFDNYEFFVYHFLARHFQGDDRIHFDIAEGPDLYYQVYGMTYLLTHGDQFRGGSGISGAFAPLMLGDHRKRKRSMSVQRPYHVMLMGHWHQLLKPKGIIVNGSVKGYDEWADAQNFDFEEPRQASWLTHAERGITCEWPIALDPPGTRY